MLNRLYLNLMMIFPLFTFEIEHLLSLSNLVFIFHSGSIKVQLPVFTGNNKKTPVTAATAAATATA